MSGVCGTWWDESEPGTTRETNLVEEDRELSTWSIVPGTPLKEGTTYDGPVGHGWGHVTFGTQMSNRRT